MRLVLIAAMSLVFSNLGTSGVAACRMEQGGIKVSVGVSGPGDLEVVSQGNGVIHRYLQNIIRDDRIDFTCSTDVFVGDTYAVVRSGKYRDRISFFGVRSDGVIAATGMHLNRDYRGTPLPVEIEPLPTSFVARFDHQGKRRVRFCFQNGQWLGSVESGDNQAPEDCRISIPTVGQSVRIQ